MSAFQYLDIVNHFRKEIEDCSLEEEQKYVRTAFDEIWKRILELTRKPFYCHIYKNISFSRFEPDVENLRIRGKISNLGNSLMTCPEKRPRRFHYPSHEMCLDDFVWEIFHNQMRSKDPDQNTTVLLMCLEFVNGHRMCRVLENDDAYHAEENALRFLEKFKIKYRRIQMYISRSPCKLRCLPKIKSFIRNQDMMERLYIRFSSVHEHYDLDEMRLLWGLKADIGVFSEDDWDHLEKHLTKQAYKYVRREFKEMRGHQREGATSESEDYTETTSTEQSDDTENDCDTDTNDYSENDNSGTDFEEDNIYETDDEKVLKAEDENPRGEVFSKRKFESDSDSDDIYTKPYKKISPIKYEDEIDDETN